MTALLLTVVAPGFGTILFAALQSATLRDETRTRVEDAAVEAWLAAMR